MDKNELKIAAMREEVTNLTERVADLRADITLMNQAKQEAEQRNVELQQRVNELEAAAQPQEVEYVEGEVVTTPEDV